MSSEFCWTDFKKKLHLRNAIRKYDNTDQLECLLKIMRRRLEL